jgi:hypothetical protein
VAAHFDPHGHAADYFLRHLDELAKVCPQIVVVSTAELTEGARADLKRRAELIERTNEGYDFFSWKVGLDSLGAWWESDGLILVNDSVVGPLVPYETIIDEMSRRAAPFWGITASREMEPHLQSFLLGFESATLESPLLRAFWHGMVPLANRAQVIAHYERGLSKLLTVAGLSGKPYFEATAKDEVTARLRRSRYAYKRARTRALGRQSVEPTPSRRRSALRAGKFLVPEGAYNPMIALWDRALPGRLPFVKLETLRDDPYRLDDEHQMLSKLERRHPEAFAGVRDHLERTSPAYEELGRGRVRR